LETPILPNLTVSVTVFAIKIYDEPYKKLFNFNKLEHGK